MTRPMTRKNLPQTCICGHPKAYHDHTDAAVELDNASACTNITCECEEYIELCPLCRHRQPHHNGALGECMVQPLRGPAGMPCGCKHYAVAS